MTAAQRQRVRATTNRVRRQWALLPRCSQTPAALPLLTRLDAATPMFVAADVDRDAHVAGVARLILHARSKQNDEGRAIRSGATRPSPKEEA